MAFVCRCRVRMEERAKLKAAHIHVPALQIPVAGLVNVNIAFCLHYHDKIVLWRAL